jgi:hypothetical protein
MNGSQYSPSPVLRSDSEAGWERVPDRAGEGSWMKLQMLEFAEQRCPHPGFAHLLPSFGREKVKTATVSQVEKS